MRRSGAVLALLVALVAGLAGPGASTAVAQATTTARGGLWLVAADGGLFALGAAPFRGSAGAIRLNRPIVGAAATAAGTGYWMVASDGGIFAFGDARFAGSTGALRLNQPIVGMAPTHTGAGYWLVAADGGIFAFGDAPFLGSLGALRLNQPIVGMAPTFSGNGYWLVAADGGIFAFGDARFFGSGAGRGLTAPVVGMAASAPTGGYWLAAADGTVLAFGTAGQLGPPTGRLFPSPIGAIVASGSGYVLVAANGATFGFGDTTFTAHSGGLRLNRPIVAAAEPVPFAGESILPGTYVERPDSFPSVTYAGGVPNVAMAIADCFCRERASFSVSARPGPDLSTMVETRITNVSGVPFEFPTGLLVRFRITRDGQPFREVNATGPSIRTLPPGGIATAAFQFTPDTNGRYDLGAETTIVIR